METKQRRENTITMEIHDVKGNLKMRESSKWEIRRIKERYCWGQACKYEFCAKENTNSHAQEHIYKEYVKNNSYLKLNLKIEEHIL